ncbi:hypothetical protein A8C75_20850 [Marinobacterium aestuarii]|uniref:Uncharacterized protein n=1 Tax=Marinobacterium aestuarii TaxID=1821621 RepID=A0A1A9F4P0_9GAMM|nr:hypothetical protein [Marinobacterium aestuarii]ANG64683.1 hypothetical protein A8C75_20850 [Marinobacterium aestuarii]
MKSTIAVCATLALLLAGSAQANHCDADLADAEQAIGTAAVTLEPNALDAADALVDHAITACEAEEDQLATAEPDSPMADPDYVTVGQSMLINATQLASGN